MLVLAIFELLIIIVTTIIQIDTLQENISIV